MTGIAFSSLCYEGAQGRVNWRGLQPGDDDAFDAFLCSEVEARLHDRCQLIALYLPCTVADLPTRMSGGKP